MKKPERRWMAILAVLAGMAWAAGASSHYQVFVPGKPYTLGS